MRLRKLCTPVARPWVRSVPALLTSATIATARSLKTRRPHFHVLLMSVGGPQSSGVLQGRAPQGLLAGRRWQRRVHRAELFLRRRHGAVETARSGCRLQRPSPNAHSKPRVRNRICKSSTQPPTAIAAPQSQRPLSPVPAVPTHASRRKGAEQSGVQRGR